MTADCQKLIATLVHDLRQPLSTIQGSACYLDLLLSDASEPVREQLRMILRQVDRADAILCATAAGALSRAPSGAPSGPGRFQNVRDGVENFELTKSASAVVT